MTDFVCPDLAFALQAKRISSLCCISITCNVCPLAEYDDACSHIILQCERYISELAARTKKN